MTVSAVLFDVDGTLVDSNGWHVRAWREAFEANGHRIEDERIAAEIGKGGDLLVPAILPDVSDDLRDAIVDRHDALFKDRYLAQVEPFPEAAALVRRVHDAGARVVLASSASGDELDHYVRLLGIGEWVDATTTADDVETAKPAPDIFAVAIERAGDPDSVRAVGDSPYDIESAAKAGIGTIAVLSGGFPRARLEGAEAIYADVGDLLGRFEDSPLAR